MDAFQAPPPPTDWWESTGLPIAGLPADAAQPGGGFDERGRNPDGSLASGPLLPGPPGSGGSGGGTGGGPGGAADHWIEFTNRLGGYTGAGGAFDASQHRSGASGAATAARGNLQGTVDAYNAQYGTHATVTSGDRIDFGDGAGSVDVLRDAGGGQSGFWLGGGPSQGNPGSGGSGGGGAWTEGGGPQTGAGGGSFATGGAYPTTMPGAPSVQGLDAPAPFTSTAPQIGTFQGPAPAPGYQNATAPGTLTAQQLGRPQALTYTPGQTPTAFAGSRQGTPGALSYENMATPADYQHQDYTGPTEEQMKADPSYKVRYERGLDALQNTRAASGMFRTGNTGKALIDYGQESASQEYAAIDARSRATNASNNAGQLGAYQTNAQTGLAYGQDRNANALQFGQANLTNVERANSDNYARASGEAQQGFQNRNAVEQQTQAGAMNAAAGNNAATLARTQANNATNLAYGAQNFNQGFAVNQANNAGQQAAQAQQYGQAANTFGLNTGAQAQQFGQQLGAYQTNTGTALSYNQNANQSALANYQAATNAALGYGNLGLGYQNSNNAFTLGQGSLGVQQGQLRIGYGQLGLQSSAQNFNQGLATYDRNYAATVTDPWQHERDLANAGRPNPPQA